MKKALILSVLAVAAASSVSSVANAATGGAVCAAPTAAGTGTAFTAGDSTEFVKVAFTPKCSANVHMAYSQSANAFGSVAGSSKGKNYFGGGTGGGGIGSMGTCATTGCSTTEVSVTNATTKRDAT